jgi:hypothetical protein
MFQARRAHHQERQIVLTQLLLTVTPCWWQLPEAVLTQFVSPDDEHDMLETGREL